MFIFSDTLLSCLYVKRKGQNIICLMFVLYHFIFRTYLVQISNLVGSWSGQLMVLYHDLYLPNKLRRKATMSSAKKIGLFACTGVVAGNMMGSGIALLPANPPASVVLPFGAG
nr:lysine/cadaverine antiporter [Klebsiella pneumoniae]